MQIITSKSKLRDLVRQHLQIFARLVKVLVKRFLTQVLKCIRQRFIEISSFSTLSMLTSGKTTINNFANDEKTQFFSFFLSCTHCNTDSLPRAICKNKRVQRKVSLKSYFGAGKCRPTLTILNKNKKRPKQELFFFILVKHCWKSIYICTCAYKICNI